MGLLFDRVRLMVDFGFQVEEGLESHVQLIALLPFTRLCRLTITVLVSAAGV